MKTLYTIFGLLMFTGISSCSKNETEGFDPNNNDYKISSDSLICGSSYGYLRSTRIQPDELFLQTDSVKWYNLDFSHILSTELILDTIFEDTGSFWMVNHHQLNADTFLLTVTGCHYFVLTPEMFTPNGDGINDVWYPVVSTFITNTEWKVMDMNATVIYSSTGDPINDFWDGTVNNHNGPEGNYMYWVKYDTPHENGISKTGIFELRR